jgi:hypothetical protein
MFLNISRFVGYEAAQIDTELYNLKMVTITEFNKTSCGYQPPPVVERQVTRPFYDYHSPRCHQG